MAASNGRPVPLHGRVECEVMDFQSWKRRQDPEALAHGRLSPAAVCQLVQIVEPLAADAGTLAGTQALIGAISGAAEGHYSDKAQRRWRALHRRGQVVPFPRNEDGPRAA